MTPPAQAALADVRDADAARSEREARIQLAACYRLFDHLGWTELIYNHVTVKVPGPERHFLINPFGLHYREVTASNLVKVDLDGNIVGQSDWPINPAGFLIHSAVHAARHDVACAMHTHTTAGMAVACLEDGLLQTNFYSAMAHDQIAYHDFEGLTTRPDEMPRLVQSLGDRNLMILRNHGLLACGRSLPEAFVRLWTLQRACEIQLATLSMGRAVRPVSEEVALVSTEAALNFDPDGRGAERVFAAMRRLIDERDPSYRD